MDLRPLSVIRAEQRKNAELQRQQDAFNSAQALVGNQLLGQMNGTSPSYLTARANAMGDMTAQGNVGGNMYARQLNQQRINPASTGYNAALGGYYARLASANSGNLNQLQQQEEQRKLQAGQQYMNLYAGGQNAVQQQQYGQTSIWGLATDLAGIYGSLAGTGKPTTAAGGSGGGSPTMPATSGNSSWGQTQSPSIGGINTNLYPNGYGNMNVPINYGYSAPIGGISTDLYKPVTRPVQFPY